LSAVVCRDKTFPNIIESVARTKTRGDREETGALTTHLAHHNPTLGGFYTAWVDSCRTAQPQNLTYDRRQWSEDLPFAMLTQRFKPSGNFRAASERWDRHGSRNPSVVLRPYQDLQQSTTRSCM